MKDAMTASLMPRSVKELQRLLKRQLHTMLTAGGAVDRDLIMPKIAQIMDSIHNVKPRLIKEDTVWHEDPEEDNADAENASGTPSNLNLKFFCTELTLKRPDSQY
jgi:hypothetical protein